MNKKILFITLLSVFLLALLTSISVVGAEKEVKQDQNDDTTKETGSWSCAWINGRLTGSGNIGREVITGFITRDITINGMVTMNGLSIGKETYRFGDVISLHIGTLLFSSVGIGDCLDPNRIQVSGLGFNIEVS